ncbi:MAG TPA: type I-B CRISPR-associated protein Cas7/Cst2/DevR [Blastocatellia bacterium]|jgi:CRISPR-associated protein Cst2|nr:type I-B CRISPR-associated protein Cas7/Cst2/DevR [Blastocatellia bacterium]
MSKHLFGLVVTPYGAAANNRGETDGNITTLQKLLWKNEVHTTVSAEAIRWALRYFWQRSNGKESVNRRWNEETAEHEWQDQTWKPWTSKDEAERSQPTFIDDDAMGFMLAEAASTDGNDTLDNLKDEKNKLDGEFKQLSRDEQKEANGKSLKERIKLLSDQIKVMSQGTTDKRRGALEVTRAISLAPFAGDITFNAKSGKKTNVSLYGTEVHATRYQYGIALTPESLREPTRVLDVIDAVTGLSEVAGNQSRFLYDFAPESIVFRWAEDFAPRLLYGFEMDADANLSFPTIVDKVKNGDIAASELYVGGSIVRTLSDADREHLNGDGNGAFLHEGVKATAENLKQQVRKDLGI